MEYNGTEACISVERTVKVWKEDATQACKSIRPEIGLPDLTMEDISEIWDTLKAEGRVLSFCTDNYLVLHSSFCILDFIGEHKFFVRNLANQDWMNNNNDILIINLNDKTLIKGENSKDFVVPPKHYFICKYYL